MNKLKLIDIYTRRFEYKNIFSKKPVNITLHLQTLDTTITEDNTLKLNFIASIISTDATDLSLNLELGAEFQILDSHSTESEMVDEYMYLLYPHIRAIISTTTSVLNGQAIVMPSID